MTPSRTARRPDTTGACVPSGRNVGLLRLVEAGADANDIGVKDLDHLLRRETQYFEMMGNRAPDRLELQDRFLAECATYNVLSLDDDFAEHIDVTSRSSATSTNRPGWTASSWPPSSTDPRMQTRGDSA